MLTYVVVLKTSFFSPVKKGQRNEQHLDWFPTVYSDAPDHTRLVLFMTRIIFVFLLLMALFFESVLDGCYTPIKKLTLKVASSYKQSQSKRIGS